MGICPCDSTFAYAYKSKHGKQKWPDFKVTTMLSSTNWRENHRWHGSCNSRRLLESSDCFNSVDDMCI